jgi:glycosyltransferase involved in cell wall biosynthesis
MDNAPRRTIVILSTEPWGKMLLSKMHFALELAGRGNKVFFVNPPRPLPGGQLATVGEEMEGGRLTLIHTKTVRGSLFLRHKLFFLYRRLNGLYIRAIRKLVGGKINEVWSFNPNQFVDLTPFHADRSILLLYDFYRGDHIVRAARSADALISVSQVILDHYKDTPPPKLFLQHGLGSHFANLSRRRLEAQDFGHSGSGPGKVKVGYTGNLLREGMNTEIAREIIGRHSDIEFHFLGPFSLKDNNVSSVVETPKELLDFIEFLQGQANVFLHGVVGQQELSERLFEMDAFLFIYSSKKEMNGASNAHKLLEYISTGKVVISTHVSTYAGTDLMLMSGPADEQALPEMFSRAVGELSVHNSVDRQVSRIRYALDNTYARQIDRVQQFITR